LALVECNNCRLRQQLRRTQQKLKQRKGLMVLQLGVKKLLKHLIGA
jgi:IS1 family transposase